MALQAIGQGFKSPLVHIINLKINNMEKLKSLDQLKHGDRITMIDGERVEWYEYLGLHPHNRNYIFVIDGFTENGKKLYINNILNTKYYIGETDMKFIMREQLKYYQEQVKKLSEELLALEPKEQPDPKRNCRSSIKDCSKCEIHCIYNSNDPEKYPQE